jgi:hypothetical protein
MIATTNTGHSMQVVTPDCSAPSTDHSTLASTHSRTAVPSHHGGPSRPIADVDTPIALRHRDDLDLAVVRPGPSAVLLNLLKFVRP